MLFRIDESIATLFHSGAATAQDYDALGLLLLGVSEGNHRLAGARPVLRKLADIQSLSPRERNTLVRAIGRASEEGHLIHALRTVGRVVAESLAAPLVSTSGEQRIIRFPLRWFDRSSKIQPVDLLGENLSDVKVFRIMGESGVALAGLNYLPLASCSHTGGGSTTGIVLGHLADQASICLCIVDSDKICPTSEVGGTAKSVAKYKQETLYPLLRVLETRGRDLENLLPDSFYISTYGSSAASDDMVTILPILTSQGEIETRVHIDVEKGFRLHDVFNLVDSSPEKEFWASKLPALVSYTGKPAQSIPCLTSAACLRSRRHECTCVVVKGNPSNVLDEFVEAQAGKDRFKIKAELDKAVRPEWLNLGLEIGSWCCADARLRL